MPELATKADIAELKSLIENQSLSIKVWFGGLLVIAISALGAFIKLF